VPPSPSLRRTVAASAATLVLPLALAPTALAAGEPARGAPTGDLIPATIVGLLLAAGGVAFGELHRRGRTGMLTRLAGVAERFSGMPGWVALPSLLAAVALVTACFGFYWDVATHIDDGRDPGPFANTSHFFILAGLGGIVLAGYVAVLLGTGRRTSTSIALRPGWHLPLGGVLLLLCGGFSISGFPLDDVWHRLFGQDVTLWGPTHVLMIAGASLSTLAIWVLLAEGRRAEAHARGAASGASGAGPARAEEAARGGRPLEERTASLVRRLRGPGVAGGFLIGLSTLQLEFDYGVPQYRLLFHPIMIALAAGIGLVAARALLGRFGALKAAGFYIAVNALITLLVGPMFGHTTMRFPLYLAEAAIIELVALRVPRDRPLALGAVSGLLIGTVGLAAEWAWSHLAMPIPWTSALFPGLAVAGLAAGLAGGVLGGAIARALDTHAFLVRPAPRWLVPAAAASAVAVLAVPLWTAPGPPLRAGVTLDEARPGPAREVNATVRVDPPAGADGAAWMSVLAWQGGGSRLEHLRETAPGVWRTTGPVPVHGEWKTMVRLHGGRSIRALPIYMPEDRAIPAPAVPARPRFTRAFVPDKQILQREAVGSSALQLPAYLALAAVAAVWLAAMAWGLARLSAAGAVAATGAERRSAHTPPRVSRLPRARPPAPAP
jgi:hypothetical protein